MRWVCVTHIHTERAGRRKLRYTASSLELESGSASSRPVPRGLPVLIPSTRFIKGLNEPGHKVQGAADPL